jgi:3',5'-cyclic AMP phosphodiesterase CpdA
MSETITLAHISDVHLSPLYGVGLRHMNIKRSLGYLNWHRQRRHTHHRVALDAVIDDMLAMAPDHVAVTGDLINLGLPAEYEAASVWLTELGSPRQVTAIPGNHDIYTTLRGHPGVALWNEYMRADEWGARFSSGGQFPFVRRVGPLALIGLNSAIETPPFVAAGEVGERQIAALDTLLPALEAEGMIRVVLIHHPPLPGQAPPRRGLRDAAALSRVLAQRGAELVLHGHNHRDMHEDFARLPEKGAHGSIPVVGIASGSSGRVHKEEPLGRYNLLRIANLAGRARIECITRGLVADSGKVEQIARRVIS